MTVCSPLSLLSDVRTSLDLIRLLVNLKHPHTHTHTPDGMLVRHGQQHPPTVMQCALAAHQRVHDKGTQVCHQGPQQQFRFVTCKSLCVMKERNFSYTLSMECGQRPTCTIVCSKSIR